MNKTTRFLTPALCAVAALGAIMYSAGAAAVNLTATATATVIAPLVLAEVGAPSMNFGTVADGAAGGTIVMDPLNVRTPTGDANAIAALPGTAGSFTVTGESAQAYTISFTAGTLSDGGGNTMGVGSFTLSSTPVLTGGADAFTVGATLTMVPSQVAGAYSTASAGGTDYTVTANYD